MSRHQDRHEKLIHIRNRMANGEETTLRIHGKINKLSSQTCRHRLHEAGLRLRCSLKEQILNVCQEQIDLIWHVFDFTHGNKFQFPVHFSDQSNPSKQKSWKTCVSLICFTIRLL